MFDFLVVGAGFAGSVIAERLARKFNKKVLICDRRNHIGGNAYDHYNEQGILVHKYGPHIFHTNSADVFDLTSDELEKWFDARAEKREQIRTSEDVVVGRVGRELYEKMFRGYTRKQWGVDPSQLDRSVTARVPTRTDTDDRYFGDGFQNMPRHGYTRMFENMLDHPNIKIMLNTDYREIQDEIWYDKLVFTGPIDEFFDFRYGKFPYRSLRFRHETLEREWLQPVAVVNHPSADVPYTRVTEYKHL